VVKWFFRLPGGLGEQLAALLTDDHVVVSLVEHIPPDKVRVLEIVGLRRDGVHQAGARTAGNGYCPAKQQKARQELERESFHWYE
jgi:hypothetical protein